MPCIKLPTSSLSRAILSLGAFLFLLGATHPPASPANVISVPDDRATLAAAVADAGDGDVIRITDSGVYEGGLVIDRSLSIVAAPRQKPTIAADQGYVFIYTGSEGKLAIGSADGGRITLESGDHGTRAVAGSFGKIALSNLDIRAGGTYSGVETRTGGVSISLDDVRIDGMRTGIYGLWIGFAEAPEESPVYQIRNSTMDGLTGTSNAILLRTFVGSGSMAIESSRIEGGAFALTADLRAADPGGPFIVEIDIADSVLASRRPSTVSAPVRLRAGEYRFSATGSVFVNRELGAAFEVSDDDNVTPGSIYTFDHCDFIAGGNYPALSFLGAESQVTMTNSIAFAAAGRPGIVGNASSSLTSRHNGIAGATPHADWQSKISQGDVEFARRAFSYHDRYGVDFRYSLPIPLLTASESGRPVGSYRDFARSLRVAASGPSDSWVLFATPPSHERVSWFELDGVLYGAKPDSRGPIGGGEGYTDIITTGDYIVETDDELANALLEATAGEIVFIPGDLEIDLTALIYVEDLVLQVSEGVTLASDRGHNGSKGALLTSDALDTPNMIRVMGPDVRITGLRLQGPNPKQYLDHHYRAFRGGRDHPDDGGDPARRNHRYYYKFPTSVGIRTDFPRLQVDNCEISAFGHAAIFLAEGEGHLIHHNYIHHCQYHGLGYGVSHNRSSSIIEYNHFNYNRHSIAGSGRPGSSYIARHNVELGISSEHCFDMHGGSSRGDGTDIAGATIDIHNNTFFTPITPAEYYADRPNAHAVINIRGTPEEEAIVTRNWMPKHSDPEKTIFYSENTLVIDNAYEDPPVVK